MSKNGCCGGKSKEDIAMELMKRFLSVNSELKNEVNQNIDKYLNLYAKILHVVQYPRIQLEKDD